MLSQVRRARFAARCHGMMGMSCVLSSSIPFIQRVFLLAAIFALLPGLPRVIQTMLNHRVRNRQKWVSF